MNQSQRYAMRHVDFQCLLDECSTQGQALLRLGYADTKKGAKQLYEFLRHRKIPKLHKKTWYNTWTDFVLSKVTLQSLIRIKGDSFTTKAWSLRMPNGGRILMKHAMAKRWTVRHIPLRSSYNVKRLVEQKVGKVETALIEHMVDESLLGEPVPECISYYVTEGPMHKVPERIPGEPEPFPEFPGPYMDYRWWKTIDSYQCWYFKC